MSESIVQTPDGSYLGLEPGRANQLCRGGQGPGRARRDPRPAARAALLGPRAAPPEGAHGAQPRRALSVLSYNEIVPTVRVETVGLVSA